MADNNLHRVHARKSRRKPLLHAVCLGVLSRLPGDAGQYRCTVCGETVDVGEVYGEPDGCARRRLPGGTTVELLTGRRFYS